VDTGLVGEGAPTGDVVVEGDLDLDGLGDQVLDLSEHAQVVLGLDGLGVGSVHSGDETTERGDTVSLSDTELDALDEEREGASNVSGAPFKQARGRGRQAEGRRETYDGGVDVGSPGFQSGVGVGDS
jgi:hypothetical protein